MTRTEDWADYLDPAEPDPDLPAEQRDALDRVTASLSTEHVWAEPPAGLRASILEAADRERTTRPADEAPADVVVPLRRRSRRRWYLAIGGVAAAAALVAVLAWPRTPTTSFPIAGTALAPRASAVAELEPRSAGLAIVLQIKGLAPAPPGTYYAAWLRGTAGIVPVGSFHWHRGGIPINLWSGVAADRYPELFVTLQHEGQPPTPSSEVVLTGRVR